MTSTIRASPGSSAQRAVTALPPGTPPLVEVGSPTSVLKLFLALPFSRSSPCIIGNMAANIPVARLMPATARSSVSGSARPLPALRFSSVSTIGSTLSGVAKNCRTSRPALVASLRSQLPGCGSGEISTVKVPSDST